MTPQQLILLIEDNPDDQILITANLGRTEFGAWQIRLVSRLSEALDFLQEAKPSLILLDLSLPDSSGIESFNTLHRESQSAPIIVMTGLSDVSLARQLLKLGAQDYLVKGEFDTNTLEKSMSYALERQQLKFEKDRAQERLIESVLKAQDEERARIAKELHDGVVQSLTAVSLNLSLLKKELGHISDEAAEHFNQSYQNLNGTIDEIRNISHSLMPKIISERTLIDAIKGLAEDLEKSTGIQFEFVTNAAPDTEGKLKITIYRIVQELINNAVKHSKAGHVLIQLLEYPDSLTLMVEDDGQGFDLLNVRQEKNCFGLSSIESRVHALDARFELDSRPGYGTNVLISFPK